MEAEQKRKQIVSFNRERQQNEMKDKQRWKVGFDGDVKWKWKTNKTNMADDGADTIEIKTNGETAFDRKWT